MYMPGGDNIKSNATPNSPDWRYHVNKGVEPYKFKWDGTKEGLYNGSYNGCNTTPNKFY